MKYFKCCVLILFCLNPLYASLRIENLSDYNFGLVRPTQFPSKESTLRISLVNYTVTIVGQHDKGQAFNLANGMYLVPYSIIWKDIIGSAMQLFPNTVSPIFRGAVDNNASAKAIQAAILSMQIQGNAPRPGHYSDTLTLIITPA